jgi:hypothetical protein
MLDSIIPFQPDSGGFGLRRQAKRDAAFEGAAKAPSPPRSAGAVHEVFPPAATILENA